MRLPLLLLALGSPMALAEPVGVSIHGAGGPFVSTFAVTPRQGGLYGLVSSGGYGYTYFLDGRFRLGGGGQGTLASFDSGGQVASLGFGTIYVAWDFLAGERWELPIGLSIGGGRLAVEKQLTPTTVERFSEAFFATQVSASLDYRLFRTIKLALFVSWVIGVNGGGVLFNAAEASLRLVFLLPRPGY